ncbi:basement membrane-specific heparan sulfate proteoglycan core protein [Culex quinquefasciatus]|uniref:basement membrane-specific heparan sulfate proteoglycan core protein n=1 Tax=Culex quinquefasciatus TaxID=7176 RepID=UPI0018E2A626|nr:basement membrane-specific heparan sulfate proteoglycan core protein [Culex quinquefasciatus]
MLAGSTSGGSFLRVVLRVVILGLVLGESLAGEVYRDEQCAVLDAGFDPRIGHGEEADKSDWPWHGALFFGRLYKCGCTLVNEWFVLTAAHCCFNPDTGYGFSVALLRVKLGVFDLSQHHVDQRTAWEYEVDSVKVHPEFTTGGHRHDLALMLLKKSVEQNQFVRPIALDVGDSSWIELSAGTSGTVVGWGLTESDTLSNELRLALMPIVRYVDCAMSNPAVFGQLIHTGMFCAGAKNGSSVCNGDSGGGMYVSSRDNQWKLRGVVSFGATRDGTNLCDLYSFAVFVNVPHYKEWIQQELDSFDRQVRVPRIMNPDASTGTSTTTSTTTTSTTTWSPPTNTALNPTPPECFQQFKSVFIAERNSSISLVCNYEPNSTIRSIRWTREIGEYRQQVELSSDLTYGESVRNDILTLLHLEADHSGRYSCAVEYGDRTTVRDNRTVSVIGVIPRFDRGAYMALPIRIRGDYFNLKLSFHVEKLSGTLFHAEDGCGKELVSVVLNNGKVEFQYWTERNTTRKITSLENGVQLGQWHKLEIKILHGKGLFLLDKRLQELFHADIASESCYVGQDFVYLGGYENSVESGLVGCISGLVLNDEQIDLWNSSTRAGNVTQCLPCFENPCQNGGVCVESLGSDPVQCFCEEGFVGRRCSNRGTGCSSNPCRDGICKDHEEGFRCMCPNDKTGRFCERPNVLSGESLRFDSYGYALYRITSATNLQIRFQVKISVEQRSLVAFLSEDNYDANNGIALLLADNKLQLQIFQDMEVKPLVLQSSVALKLDNWYSVLIELQGKEVYFQVDYESALITNVSSRSDERDRNLHLGGLDEHINSYRFNGSRIGFSGCIGELTISNVPLNMSTSFSNAKNVENCH